jgi:hypothetical protein
MKTVRPFGLAFFISLARSEPATRQLAWR